ncbi:SusD/RagB family nutrient-binding outer membrane lipoprotein [Lacihabitans lacunae]|uniref:SusD/RagB family nutrient-binding outer membrane lipoprotein n=1 Tax=Lacihabitans lacunae TaxID=1028214 RepID=A0ABV7YR47_9BACT
MKIKSIIILAVLALSSTACKESFLDINTNPNTLPTASPNYVFTNALNTTSTNMLGSNETGQYWAGQWSQSNGYIISTTIFAYNFTNGDFNYWDGAYDNLNDYEFVINNSDSYNQKFLKGPAKVMKALVYQQLVDMYGNIPYTNALKGVGSLAPKFDDQKTVYEGLIKLLDEALVDIKANNFASAFTGSDIVFKGNTAKWAQFANALKLRILIHQAKISGRDAYIKTELSKIAAEGSGFLKTEEVGVGGSGFYLATAGKLNPIYDRWGYDANGAKRALNNYPRLTEFLVNNLKASGDTLRLKRLGYAIGGESATAGVSTKAEVAANYIGVPFGKSSGFLPAGSSSLGPSLLVKGEYNRPFVLMTAAEVNLLLAEASQRYADVSFGGTAEDFFKAGITQSYRALGASSDKAAAYIGSGIQNYDYKASSDKLKAIAYQKWIALCNFNGLEAWTEYRRNNYPVTPQSVQVVDETRPVRLYYPNTESGSNAENVNAQGKINVFTSKLFWDVD